MAVFLRLVMGIAWNIIIMVVAVGLVSLPIGWLCGALTQSLRADCPSGLAACRLPHHFDFPTWIFAVAIGASVAAGAVGLTWVARIWKKEGTRRVLMGLSLGLLGFAAAWLLILIVLPLLLEWIRASVGATTAHKPVTPGKSASTVVAVGGASTALSILTAVFGARVVRTAKGGWNQLSSTEQKQLKSRAMNLLTRLRMPIINLLAFVSGPLMVASIITATLYLGALYRPLVDGSTGTTVFFSWLGAIALFILIWIFADLTAWSMQPFYKERLSAAFFLKRFTPGPGAWSPTAMRIAEGPIDATRRPYDFRYVMSQAQPESFPELIICAAANVSKYGATPTDSRVSSFVFSEKDIGGPLVGSFSAEDYEAALRDMPWLIRNVTLPAAVSMSGAALSPEMGRMTRMPLRFLLTLFNIRLGVWMPNPNRLTEFMVRGSSWHRFRLRPRISYLLREMIGKNDPESKFLYVTDGGHYENLGLVELVRRGCRYIWCVDASGEKQDGFSTIADAVALAYDELGIRIDIDPASQMAPDPEVTVERQKLGLREVVRTTFATGTIHYGPNDVGRLVIIKTGVPADAPLDVMNFYQSNKNFPCDSTIDQLYTADHFDAYRALGAFAASKACDDRCAEFDHFIQNGRRIQRAREGK